MQDVEQKIVHLWKRPGPAGGGGAVALWRYHRAMLELGVDSRIVGDDAGCAPAEQFSRMPKRRQVERVLRRVTERLEWGDLYRVGSKDVLKHEWVRRADVLDLHGTHSGFLSFRALPAITGEKPTLFTMHDMWMLTGHCVFSLDCQKYTSGCGGCPYPETYPAIDRDTTAFMWKQKDRAYARSRLSVVCPTRWMAERAGEGLFARFPVYYLPYGLHLDEFYPVDKAAAKEALGIGPCERVIFFAAADLKDRRKGADLLTAAILKLPESLRRECLLLTMGGGGGAVAEATGLRTVATGRVDGDRLKPVIYSAADVFAFPTRADSPGLVSLESMACGTPVVAFAAAGVPEVVRDDETGRLAAEEAVDGFAAQLERGLTDAGLRARLGAGGRAYVAAEHDVRRLVLARLALAGKARRGETGEPGVIHDATALAEPIAAG